MVWNLDLKGVIVFACNVAGVGDPHRHLCRPYTVKDPCGGSSAVEATNSVKDWAISKIADRVASVVIGALV